MLVLDLAAVGVPEADAKALTAHVAEAAGRRSDLSVMAMADVQAILDSEKTKQLLGCKEDYACVSRVSEATRAELVLSGSLGKIGGSFVLSLALVDARHADPISRASETLDRLSEAKEVVAGMVSKIFGSNGQEAKKFALPQGKKFSFAVVDLEPAGLSKEAASNLTQILSVEVKRVEGASVISREDISAILAQDKLKQLLGAGCDTSCVAEIGGALGVDRLVVGKVGKLAESYVVSLRLIDPNTVSVENRITESFQGREEELIRAVRHAARSLLGIRALPQGSIAVSASEVGADVFVDNTKVGELPMAPLPVEKLGRHSVRIAKDGFYDWQSEIYVDPGETTAVFSKLTERPEKWYQKWWVWAAVGAVAAGGGTAAVILAQPRPENGAGSVVLP